MKRAWNDITQSVIISSNLITNEIEELFFLRSRGHKT